jgi:hypothetical protein
MGRIRMRLHGLAGRLDLDAPAREKVQALAWQLAITASNSRGFTDHWQFRVLLLLIDCFRRVRAWVR